MSTHELIEMAVLDALGILEAHESEEFEAAFAQASPGVRQQVRAEQERLTDIEDLLPDDQPRTELRDLVLAAVRAAISADRQPVAGRIGGRAPAQPRIKLAPRVSPVWRAATVALASVIVTLLAFNSLTRNIFKQAEKIAFVDGFYDAAGAGYVSDLLTGPGTSSLTFTAVSENESVSMMAAKVYHNEIWKGQAPLFFTNLNGSEGDQYRVAILDSEGNVVKELTTFTSTGKFQGVEILVDLSTLDQPLAITRISKENRSDFSADEVLMVAKTQS